MTKGVRWTAAALLGAAGVAAGVAAQTLPVRQGLLSLPDARIFYEVVGSGEPIIVIHGGPGMDHRHLRPGLDVLAGSERLVYYDQRGTGRSSADLDSAGINLDAFVSDIDQLRQALGFDRVVVLGHSFGGLLALEYAFRYPEATRALILMMTVEPGSRWRSEAAEAQRARRTAEDADAIERLVGSEGFRAGDPATVSAVYRLAFRSTMRDPDRVDEVDLTMAPSTARDGSTVARLLGGSMGGMDRWDRLSSLQAPTLVIHGTFDPTPAAMAAALADSIPGGRLVTLPTGHFPFVEDPRGLVAAVSAFLAGIR
ncbi:MAG: alpha/beta fold hydrolase [Gemmatimonadota bacterium]|nr:alpha/beta fold hydrolase [Gemmatimonadota bacterium]